MDPDFTALASRVAARAEVLGCVILSRDGLVLGSFPPHGEQDITPGLLRFASLGDPDRGFAQFADEVWAYVRERNYAAFAVADKGTRPGILLDYLEQALLVAEEARMTGEAMSEPSHVDLSQKALSLGRRLRAATPDAPDDFRAAVVAPEREAPPEPAQHAESAPVMPTVDDSALDEALAAAIASGGDRGSDPNDHATDAGPPPPKPEPEPEMEMEVHPVEETPAELVAEAPAETWAEPQPPPQDRWQEPWQQPSGQPPPEQHHDQGPGTAPGDHQGHREPEAGEPPKPPGTQPPLSHPSPDEIDRVALAREFAQLLQEGPGGAD